MDKIKYALLTEVLGRGTADVLEGFLRNDGIDVVLVQYAVSHVTHVTSFAPVKVYVPKANIKRARELLRTFNENHDNAKEKISMPNKKKMERLEAERKARQARYIQIGGVGTILILIMIAFWAFSPKKQGQSIIVKGQTACQNFSVIAKAESYTAAPPLGIDVKKQFFATVKLAKGGEFVIQLYPDKAPKTVNSFVFLACRGYFNGVTFHRVLDGFMAQTGDPTGTGSGGPGYEFEYEANDLKFDKAGVVAMANTGPATPTNGSQFFITYGVTPNLDGGYTIFGQVIKGMDVVNAITRRDPQQNPNFTGDVMESVTITEQ